MNAPGTGRTSKPAALVLLLGVALMALAAVPLRSRASSPPVPLADYWLRMDQALAAVQELRALPRSQRDVALVALAEQLLAIDQVALADGQVMAVDHSALARAMVANPSNLTRVEGMLSTLLMAQASWPEGQHSAGDLASLQAILRRAEFQPDPTETTPLQEWWDGLLEQINGWLARVLPGPAEDGSISILSVALNLVGVGALLALLAFVAKELMTSLAAEAHLRADGGDGGPPLTAESAFRRAQELAEGRDYRTAVRFLYLSSLLTLDERQLLRYDRTKTNREYLRSVASQPALAAHLREVIEVFDRVWYGFQPLDAATYERYQAHVAELRQP